MKESCDCAVLRAELARVTKDAEHLCALLLATEAERDRLRACLSDFAEGDCSYGDNCPTFGSRHGRCDSCRARKALGE